MTPEMILVSIASLSHLQPMTTYLDRLVLTVNKGSRGEIPGKLWLKILVSDNDSLYESVRLPTIYLLFRKTRFLLSLVFL